MTAEENLVSGQQPVLHTDSLSAGLNPVCATIRGRPLTIAYVVHALAPGGLERCAAWLANGLDRDCFRPLIVSLTSSSVSGWVADDVPVIELHKPSGNSLRTIAKLARVLDHHHVDIVHSHSWPTLVECVLARRWAGTRFHVHAEHGTLPNPPGLSNLRMRVRATLMRWGLGQANEVISVANAIRSKVTEFCGFPRDRMKIIPNGVDIPALASGPRARDLIRSAVGIPQGSLVIGSVGRMAAVKGFDVLLAAFEQLAAAHEQIHLILVGDGQEFENISRLTRDSLHPGRIHLVGHQSSPCDWLRAMDIYVNSSQSEGLSLAVLEAMGVGLPLVVTDVGDHGELIQRNPPCGIVVPPNDSNLLADAIDQVVVNQSLRHAFADSSWNKQHTTYSIESMIAAYANIYASIPAAARTAESARTLAPQRC